MKHWMGATDTMIGYSQMQSHTDPSALSRFTLHMHKELISTSFHRFLSSDHLLDLVLGESLELGASTDEFTAEVDVGNGSLSVEFFEVGLDCGWMLDWVQTVVVGWKTYLRSQLHRVCLLALCTSWHEYGVALF
jgi:hypothetical protein